MEHGLAAVVDEFRRPVAVREVPVPPLEPGAVLVRVDAATLCGSDVHYWDGDPAVPVEVPYIPGHEAAGTVVDAGTGAADATGRSVAVGDRVIWTYPFCGHCFYCAVAGQPTLCVRAWRPGRTRCDRMPYLTGACAEYQYVDPHSVLVHVPPEVPSALAAAASCALRTVMHAFERAGPLGPHHTVVVQGSGAVGLFATAVAEAHGVGSVLVVGGPSDRLDVARAWGADATLSLDEATTEADRRRWVLDRTDGRGSDVVFQCATAAALGEAVTLARPGGRIMSIGGGGSVGVPSDALIRGLELVSIRSGEARHYQAALRFLAARSGVVDFERVLSLPRPLDEVNAAFRALAGLEEVKPVIVPEVATGRVRGRTGSEVH